jgi:hypothetical protein
MPRQRLPGFLLREHCLTFAGVCARCPGNFLHESPFPYPSFKADASDSVQKMKNMRHTNEQTYLAVIGNENRFAIQPII